MWRREWPLTEELSYTRFNIADREPPCHHDPMSNASATSQQAADAILLDARPPQGCWREFDYLWLTDRCNRLVEFADGCIEELPAPTDSHQSILLFRDRDYRHKRADYAEAGIPEYWIVDPNVPELAVLTLDEGRYMDHGTFRPGDIAVSSVLEGFSVDVSAVFEAGALA